MNEHYKNGPVVLDEERLKYLSLEVRNNGFDLVAKMAVIGAGISLESDVAPVRINMQDGSEITGLMNTSNDFGTLIEGASNYSSGKKDELPPVPDYEMQATRAVDLDTGAVTNGPTLDDPRKVKKDVRDTRRPKQQVRERTIDG